VKTYGRSSLDLVVCDRIPRRRTLLTMQHRGRMPQGSGEEIPMALKPRTLPRLVHMLLTHLFPGKSERLHAMATLQHPRPLNRLNNWPWKTPGLHRPAKGHQPPFTNLPLKPWPCHCQGQPRFTELLKRRTWEPTLHQTPLKLRAKKGREIVSLQEKDLHLNLWLRIPGM
jgi:hypothetical protein